MHYKNGRELTFDEAYAARVLYVFKECPPEEALMKGMGIIYLTPLAV